MVVGVDDTVVVIVAVVVAVVVVGVDDDDDTVGGHPEKRTKSRPRGSSNLMALVELIRWAIKSINVQQICVGGNRRG